MYNSKGKPTNNFIRCFCNLKWMFSSKWHFLPSLLYILDFICYKRFRIYLRNLKQTKNKQKYSEINMKIRKQKSKLE